MADMNLGIKMPDTLPLEILDNKLTVIGEVNIGTVPATITPITQLTMVDSCVYLLLLVMLMIVYMRMKGVIVGVMMEDADVGLNISAILPFTIM